MPKPSKRTRVSKSRRTNAGKSQHRTTSPKKTTRPSVSAKKKQQSASSKHGRTNLKSANSAHQERTRSAIKNEPVLKSRPNTGRNRIVTTKGHSKSEKDFLQEAKSDIVTSAPFKISVGIIIGAIIIIIGIFIAIMFYMNTTSSKMAIDQKTAEKLVKVQDNSMFRVLFAVDTDKSQDGNYDMLLLGNASPKDKKVVFLAIPTDTYVPSSSGGGTTLADISKTKGDADLIESISQFVESSITHFAKTNAEGLQTIVDSVGGIDVTLAHQIDEPEAGSSYIPAGKSSIDGNQCITLLRATKFDNVNDAVLTNQCSVGQGLADKILNFDSQEMTLKLESIAENLKTDYTVGDCASLLKTFSGTKRSDITGTFVPGYKAKRNNQTVYISSSTDWKSLKEQFKQCDISQYNKEATIDDINPSSFTIHVQNGAGIDGAGAFVEQKLKEQGYNVIKTDNANTTAYPETLIIYSDNSMKSNAEAVKSSINNGRIVESKGLYAMDSDILIIIGADLKM